MWGGGGRWRSRVDLWLYFAPIFRVRGREVEEEEEEYQPEKGKLDEYETEKTEEVCV